ncbi:hypothetical protein SBOR_7442 [Sclerotinia borealis F-4128]|uniref:Uncharacterized protein n=1 Tax=Sclerotinia borealis (strain F-4128) TaxID=1432307 RepID=W9CC94_SCLBF|nr:hypothetical protein SBOR_7442 [Sclerotinia borealis F-4128]
MILAKFTRLPIPPLTIESIPSNDYQPWHEALRVKYDHSASKQWANLSSDIVSSMRNHHRDYQYWNYKICKVEIMWRLGRTENWVSRVLYEFDADVEYLEVHEGQHERIVTALTLQDRNSRDWMHVTYQAGESSNGQLGNVSFMVMGAGVQSSASIGGRAEYPVGPEESPGSTEDIQICIHIAPFTACK